MPGSNRGSDYAAISDEDLVRIVQAEPLNKHALEELWLRVWDYAQQSVAWICDRHRLAGRPAPDEQTANGIAKDVTTKVVLAVCSGSYDPNRGTLRGYVHSAAENEVLSWQRRLKHALGELPEEPPCLRDWLGDLERREAVWQVLNDLCESHRWALVRRYLGDATIAEMADERGMPVPRVYWLLDRARRAFRNRWLERGYGPDDEPPGAPPDAPPDKPEPAPDEPEKEANP